MRQIYENVVLQYVTEEHRKIRVIWIDDTYQYAYYISLEGDTAMPLTIKISEIEEMLSNSEIVIVPELFKHVTDEDSIPEKYKSIRDNSWVIVEYLWSNDKLKILNKDSRSEAIGKAEERFEIPEKKIKRIITRFWQKGMIKNALLPDYEYCGARGKTKSSGSVKRGRPRNVGKNGELITGINVDEDIEQIFKVSIKLFYNTKQKMSLAEAYNSMLKKFFSDRYSLNGEEDFKVWDKDRKPTYGQFYYWYAKEKDLKKEFISRHSKKEFELKLRELLGNSTMETFGPGTRYQIDATVADVYIVSSINRNRIIGRPIVYIVLDVYSRLIVGLYVGLEGPSWIGAMMALDNIIEDKLEFCKKYGIEISKEQWPDSYLPEAILADRGEFEGYNVENLINNLNIRIENTPPYRGELKGIVERNFRTVNEKIKHMTPGAIQKEFRERGDRDYRLDAILDLNDFTKIIIYEVLHHNNSIINHYPRERGLIADEVKPIPTEIWSWGLKNRRCGFKVKDRDIVRLNLLYRETAKITRRGIQFNNKLFYSCEQAYKEQWFINQCNERVNIVYDPRNMDYIYILTNKGNDFIKCSLLERCSMYKGLPVEEITLQQELESEIVEEHRDNQDQLNVDFITNSQKVIKEAKAKTKRYSGGSNRSRIKDTRENRAAEKDSIRQDEYFEVDKIERTERAEKEGITNIKPIIKDQTVTNTKLNLLKQVRELQKK